MWAKIQNTKGNRKTRKAISLILGFGLIVVLAAGIMVRLNAPGSAIASRLASDQVEPEAGRWQTWLLESGSQFRAPAPPDKAATTDEIKALQELAEMRDDTALAQITFWNTGAPIYRWNEMVAAEGLKRNMGSGGVARHLALLNAAMYDATIATWDSKYTYNRPRPNEFDPAVETVIPVPNSPSYPSEHAAVAGAASEILAYLFPEQADAFREQASQAGQAFVLAGVQYPSDVEAGLELGRQVAELAIGHAQRDGFEAQWDGTIPTGPGYWSGENPIAPMSGTWQTWVLTSGDEFRPDPPFAYDSPEKAAEMDELRAVASERTPKMMADAMFNEYGAGGLRSFWIWHEEISKKLFEYRLDQNPPHAARVAALTWIAYYDSTVACFDAKYAYWGIRPFQLDPDFQTLFRAPNHPSYPAAHSCVNRGAAEMLGYLFPADAERLTTLADIAGESRIWGGIHFRSDITVGDALGRAVAGKVIEHAQGDGSRNMLTGP